MIRWPKAVVVVGVVGMGILLAGCPGMPGAPGGAGAGEQRTPPGVLPPPGLESGGARTLMGATVTAPDNSYLLVRYTQMRGGVMRHSEPTWDSCRRVSMLENCLLIEGLNYDGRAEAAPKDTNLLIAYADLAGFEWKYEARPAPPAQPVPPAGKPQPKPGRKPQ